MPWDANATNLGFSQGTPWLPLSPKHKRLAASEQEADLDSPLNYARNFLKARKASGALRVGEIDLLDAPDPILAFTRIEGSERVLCVFNMSAGDAEFVHADIAGAKPMDIGCGNVLRKNRTLTLSPFAAWFGTL
jgi:alpha-glucosidase